LVATANMAEAARFERVLMMDDGRILADGAPHQLLERTATYSLEAAYIALLPAERRDGETEVVDYIDIDDKFIDDHQLTETHDNAEIAIESRGLTCRFGDFVAVDQVSFRIRR